ncbi:hypothetical protein KEM55_009292, partial [Ascosphaera atra]
RPTKGATKSCVKCSGQKKKCINISFYHFAETKDVVDSKKAFGSATANDWTARKGELLRATRALIDAWHQIPAHQGDQVQDEEAQEDGEERQAEEREKEEEEEEEDDDDLRESPSPPKRRRRKPASETYGATTCKSNSDVIDPEKPPTKCLFANANTPRGARLNKSPSKGNELQTPKTAKTPKAVKNTRATKPARTAHFAEHLDSPFQPSPLPVEFQRRHSSPRSSNNSSQGALFDPVDTPLYFSFHTL